MYFMCNEKEVHDDRSRTYCKYRQLAKLLTDCRNTGDQLSAQIKKLLRDTTQMGNSIRQYQSMLSTNMTEQEKLNALLSQKKNELSERERTINELQDMINAQNEK